MVLFSMNGVDYTTHITYPSYQVNKMDIYEEWTDANYTEHRELVRTQTSGSLTLMFNDQTEYLNFLSALQTLKGADGAVLASFYSNKTNELITNWFYIDFEPANELPYMGERSVEGIQLTIKER